MVVGSKNSQNTVAVVTTTTPIRLIQLLERCTSGESWAGTLPVRASLIWISRCRRGFRSEHRGRGDHHHSDQADPVIGKMYQRRKLGGHFARAGFAHLDIPLPARISAGSSCSCGMGCASGGSGSFTPTPVNQAVSIG